MKIILASIAMLLPSVLIAAPNEIKVFTDELAGYGEYTLETHVNKASKSAPLQVMPEYSYGIRPNWEFSLQAPLAAQHGNLRSNGYRAELQYVAPHDDGAGFYWGLNAELAHVARIGEPEFWNTELIPILGWRSGRWHAAANPGFSLPIAGGGRKLSFEPAAKLAYRTFEKNYFGLEYYRDERSRTLYFAWDGKIGKSDINVGIGRGLSGATDRWVLKAIYEFAF